MADESNKRPANDEKPDGSEEAKKAPVDFIRQIVEADIQAGKHDGRVVTRFPPEPNGYLHIGHAKAITIDYGIAENYGGTYHLRFDDTNPTKEDTRYSDAIMRDIKWLGYDWGERLFHASDYFDRLHEFAVRLIKDGNAYVCDLSPEETREYRGTLTAPGRNSPYRDRTIEENLDLFAKMKAGEFPDGSHTLRAKIDMSSGNLNMRDPVIYRIMHASHHRTGDKWCIYPMYDFTHCLSDSMEGITHSFCDLDFEDHRPLYNWFLEQLGVHHPQQIEFARLNLSYTVMSKRLLAKLVEGGHVAGWDDPRMPTLCGLARRGYTPASIRKFCETIGIAKRPSVVDIALLEHILREELNRTSPRAMAVLRPLKIVIENYPEDQVEELDAINNPEDPEAGSRKVPFSRELYIERDDFMEDPPKKFFRLAPGREVRLRYAYFVTCREAIKDPASGEITELRCTYDPETRGGSAPDGRKVKATMHWVSAERAVEAEVRLFNSLFTKENPMDVEEGKEFTDYVNPDSLEVLTDCKLEPSLGNAGPGDRYQFERLGYFCADSQDSSAGQPVFNRTVTLRDSWARMQKNQKNSKK